MKIFSMKVLMSFPARLSESQMKLLYL